MKIQNLVKIKINDVNLYIKLNFSSLIVCEITREGQADCDMSWLLNNVGFI